jgi:hypothetical protein
MARLVVTAAASPLFSNFLMIVSVSSAADGTPVTNLKAKNFHVYQLASLNHASVNERTVGQITEGPDGFYTVQLVPAEFQPQLPPGHYVFGVVVKTSGRRRQDIHHGQTVAVGDLAP